MKPGFIYKAWTPWFAWHPVRLGERHCKRQWVWLRRVERRWVFNIMLCWCEYRLPGEPGECPCERRGPTPPASDDSGRLP